MKTKELRNKTDKELVKNLVELREKLVNAHIDLRTKEVKNVKQIKAIKKDIARVLTIMSEGERGVKTGETNE